ncbi:hypothetical protein B7P43_G16619 [Cryptotermes secundus]|uniref:Uncharacterized protein n=1 Tax=Cryptotermes secundus TaxID=105785 RepID=A0A2J7RKI5_9NEOP|nr:hypothetical protein B7P43_G16619 [Cryptotermes secundus]
MFSKSLTKHFKGFGSGFTELHTKLYADTLLNFAIHFRQNKARSQKRTRVKTVHGVTWQSDAIGLRKCDLTTITIWELSDMYF